GRGFGLGRRGRRLGGGLLRRPLARGPLGRGGRLGRGLGSLLRGRALGYGLRRGGVRRSGRTAGRTAADPLGGGSGGRGLGPGGRVPGFGGVLVVLFRLTVEHSGGSPVMAPGRSGRLPGQREGVGAAQGLVVRKKSWRLGARGPLTGPVG